MMDDNENQGFGPIFEKVLQFFEEDEWQFTQEEDKPVLSMETEGENGKWSCLAQVIEERERFLFFSFLPKFVPSLMRLEAAEYLTRANYGMEIGNFEMDFEDGEVRFRTSVDVEGGELTTTMIKNLVYTSVAVFDQYLPGLIKVVKDGMEPAKAIEEVEEEEEEE
jgi:hypothetical protein